MLCALLCTCISVLGGTLIPHQAKLYLGETYMHAAHFLAHPSLVGCVAATSIIVPVLQGMLLPPLDLSECTQQP